MLKREKHPWRSANFSKVAGSPQNGQTHSNNSWAVADELFECVSPFCRRPATLLNLALLHGRFSLFLNCKNGTKSRSASHICLLLLVVMLLKTEQNTLTGFLKEKDKT